MTSNEIKELEERQVIEAYVKYSNIIFPYWVIKECPIESVNQKQLAQGDSIPDGIIVHVINHCNKWLEITIISRTLEMRKEIGLRKKGLIKSNNRNHKANLQAFRDAAVYEISHAIIKKSTKNYTNFASIAKTELQGTLIIGLDLLDPFHDDEEHASILSNFDRHVLFSLGCGNSSFNNIILCAWVMKKTRWELTFSSIANSKMMEELKEFQKYKDSYLKKHGSETSNI